MWVKQKESMTRELTPCLVSKYRSVYQTILDHEDAVAELLKITNYEKIGDLVTGLRDYNPRHNPALRRCNAILVKYDQALFDDTFTKEVHDLERHGAEIMILTYVIMNIRDRGQLPTMKTEQARDKVIELKGYAKQFEIDLGSSIVDALDAFVPKPLS